MLEIVLIWKLAVYIGKEVTKKGLKKPLYQIMAVCLWVFGELSGSIVGEILFGIHSSFWSRYSIAVIGAMMGACISFLIMRYLPNQNENDHITETDNKNNVSSKQRFGRTFGMPLIVIFSSVFFYLVVIFGSLILHSAGLLDGQIQISNPIIGVEIDSDKEIKQPVTGFLATEKPIYIGLDLRKPHGGEVPIILDWYIDDELMWSTKRMLNYGHSVMEFNPDEFYLSKFKIGKYEIKIRSEEEILNSLKFEVK
jgi:hypothetical protein